MNSLVSFLVGFDLSPLTSIIQDLSSYVAMYISPTLLIVAIYVRTVETQLDGLVSGGKWAVAIRDMVGWGLVLGLYGSIGYFIIDFVNTINAWAESKGSLDALMKTFDVIMKKSSDRLAKDGMGFWDYAASPVVVITGLAYYLTLILTAFITTFLKVANVMVYGFAYIWGLIAIPMSITTSFRILRGWALLIGMTLVWPFVLAIFLSVFTVLFGNAGNALVVDPDLNGAIAASNIYMLFSVLHLLVIAAAVAAPFVAQALVANTPAAAGIVTPFVGAALAAGALTAKATERTGGGVGNGVMSMFKEKPKSSASSTPSPRGTRQSPGGSSPAAGGMADAASESMEASAPSHAAAPADKGVSAKLKARKNAIIKQQLKRR